MTAGRAQSADLLTLKKQADEILLSTTTALQRNKEVITKLDAAKVVLEKWESTFDSFKSDLSKLTVPKFDELHIIHTSFHKNMSEMQALRKALRKDALNTVPSDQPIQALQGQVVQLKSHNTKDIKDIELTESILSRINSLRSELKQATEQDIPKRLAYFAPKLDPQSAQYQQIVNEFKRQKAEIRIKREESDKRLAQSTRELQEQERKLAESQEKLAQDREKLAEHKKELKRLVDLMGKEFAGQTFTVTFSLGQNGAGTMYGSAPAAALLQAPSTSPERKLVRTA